MQLSSQVKPPVGIVFDANIGDRADTALALALLYGFDGKGESRVVSVSVSKPNLNAAAFCEAVSRYYLGSFARTLPIGLAVDGPAAEDTPLLTVPLAKRTPAGEPVYAHAIRHLNDTADVAPLIRNAFTAQHDQNCIVVLAGPASNLVKALALPGVKDLVARKVRLLVVAGGAFPEGASTGTLGADLLAARTLLAEWPTPIVAAGQEVGAALPYPGEKIETDFSYTPNHPIADAYRAGGTMPYSVPTTPLAAVLYAVRPQEGYFRLSEPGTISLLDSGRVRFAPEPQGRHRHLILDPAQHERVLKVYAELASAKPVPRVPRFRPQQQDAPKPPDAKPGEVKPADAKPADSKPSDAKPSDPKP